MQHMYVMIRQNESHTEIPYSRQIENYEECYEFKYAEGTVQIWDCAGLPFDEVRAISDEYAMLERLGSFAAWNYSEGD